MGVSKNRGILPPKWMVNIMENPMNKWMIWGYIPLFLETPTCSTMFSVPWIFQWKGVESMVPEKKDLSILPSRRGFFSGRHTRLEGGSWPYFVSKLQVIKFFWAQLSRDKDGCTPNVRVLPWYLAGVQPWDSWGFLPIHTHYIGLI